MILQAPSSTLFPYTTLFRFYSAATLPGDVYQGKTAVDPSNPEFIGRTLDLATIANPLPASTRAGVGWAGAARSASTSDRKSTRLNSSHVESSYAVFCLKKNNA